MSDTKEKKQDPAPKVKELLSGFETGQVQNGAAVKGSGERPFNNPGGAKKLAEAYEKKNVPGSTASSSKAAPIKIPTSPRVDAVTTSAAPVPATADEPNARPAAKAAAAPAPVQSTKKSTTSSAPAPKAVATTKCKALIVYADMERQGFNGAVLDATVQGLQKQGHTVEVTDLYRNGFNAIPTRADAGVGNDRVGFLYEESMLQANESKAASKDILAEQEKVQKADIVIFIFRFKPSGYPAMLQGYIDRVFSAGFAADFTTKRMFDQAKLKGKKAMLCMTSLFNTASFNERSAFGDLDVYLWPLQYGALRYAGFDVLKPQINDNYFYGGDIQQQALIAAWTKRIDTLLQEPAISYPSLSRFSEEDLLLPQAEVNKEKAGLSIAQHLGKGYKVGGQVNGTK